MFQGQESVPLQVFLGLTTRKNWEKTILGDAEAEGPPGHTGAHMQRVWEVFVVMILPLIQLSQSSGSYPQVSLSGSALAASNTSVEAVIKKDLKNLWVGNEVLLSFCPCFKGYSAGFFTEPKQDLVPLCIFWLRKE